MPTSSEPLRRELRHHNARADNEAEARNPLDLSLVGSLVASS